VPDLVSVRERLRWRVQR